jgi:hypothetical protein
MTAPEYDPEVDLALATALRPDSERDLGAELGELLRLNGDPSDRIMRRALRAYDIARPVFAMLVKDGAIECDHSEKETDACFGAVAAIATLALPPEASVAEVAAAMLASVTGSMEDKIAITKLAIDNVRKGLHKRSGK